jgi:hypothetical protein
VTLSDYAAARDTRQHRAIRAGHLDRIALEPALCICGMTFAQHRTEWRGSSAGYGGAWSARVCPSDPRNVYRPTGTCWRKP